MSTKSVFKFNINNVNETRKEIEEIIENYLKKHGFNYDNDEKCHMIGSSSEKATNKEMATDIIMGAVAQNMGVIPTLTTANTNLHQCLEYEIVGNQLIIKAYIINTFSKSKAYIHSKINSNMAGREYYNNLQTDLFNQLQQKNISLVDTETEKVKDGSNLKIFKLTMLCIAPFILLFTIITIIAYFLSH